MSPSSKQRGKRKFTSNPKRKRYDVYFSFCDQNLHPFVLAIYKALTLNRLVVFWDDQWFGSEDSKSKQPSDSTLNVIEDCKMAVIVFSKKYTKSIWSLRELEKITQCCQRTTDPLIVLPVLCSTRGFRGLRDFPDFVDRIPTEEETSSKDETKFKYGWARIISETSSKDEDNIKYDGEAFHHFLDRISMAKETSSEDEDKFMTWVAAITNEASKYDHISPTYIWYGRDDDIQNVVECVTSVLNKKRYSFEESMYSATQDLIQLMKQSKSPLLLGIWGMPGVGKTAIAERIFKHIGPFFKHMCFLKNVRGVWEQNNVHVSLQHELLSDINEAIEVKKATPELFSLQNDFFFDIPTIKSGSVILKEKLQHKRVLLILDDVNKLEQLQALCGNQDWFGPGSKVIITTSNRHLLKEHGIDRIVRVKELDESQSLELFNLHTSKKSTSTSVFVKLSKQIVGYYCGGLPLALKVLGRYLRGKNLLQWKSVLRSLESYSIPAPPLLEALEKSFSNLSNEEKQIFLDIACFFIGMNRNDVLQTLNRSTQCAALQINRLEDKSFVTIDENNNLEMHVLLHAMARDIIKRESSNKSNQSKRYDLFLSFRGEDCRAKFISHIYSSFQNAGINVFKDDNEIQRGDEISISLLQAIERSRISIVVLSTTYANSRWCMLELEKIMEIGRTRDPVVVVPVFYEVDPSEVRNQNGQFGKSFEDLISTISMDESKKSKWRRDLVDIAGKAGFVLIDSRNESSAIKQIVERVTGLLDRTELFVAEHPVGIETRVEAATKLLNIKNSDDVLFLGIWGMGGTGKTTIAKAIYNQIGSKFEGRSFLLNIRESWKAGTNQVSLQQHVLSEVYKTTAFKISNIESGKNILKEKLAQIRVLFVLDDVNEEDQLKVLCGSREWFGSGSRIIITTRDMHLLNLCKVNDVYTIQEMDKSESLELFSWHAFKKPIPTEDFAALSEEVIAYSGGLPLALEVLGSYLCDCKIKEWRNVLEKIKWIPNDQVQKKLQVSYDGLKYVTEKEIFLDIACFFIGMDQNDVIQILNGCGFFADDGIKVLIQRALVTVDNRNKLRMHDLLRDMGRQIVNEESDPEKRSRLWRNEEVYDILANRKGTEAIKGLALEFPIKDCLEINAFMKMNKLRLFRLAGGVKLKGDFKYISGELRWLSWNSFPETYVPAEFQQQNLVAVELKHSKLKQIWKKSQMLGNLIILNLSHSLDLTETPDFSYLPNLEKLVLKNCPSLSTVSHSIGSLHKILLINLRDCKGLRKLPRSIYKLKSLETLILSGCSMIDKLEEDLEQMESLITLIADKTAIKNVPFSVVRLKNIGYISFSDFKGFAQDVFPSLIQHWMSPSNNVISFVGTSMSMSSVGSFKDFQKLRILCVKYDSDLQLIQDKSMFLDVFKSTSSQKLEASASSNASEISEVQIFTSGSTNHLKSLLIKMGTKCQVSNIAVDNVLQTADASRDSFVLSLDNNSDWHTFRFRGCSKIFDIPTIKGRNLKSMKLFVVYYSSSENITSEGFQGVLIINYTKTTVNAYKRDTLTSFEDEDWQSITSNLEPGNKVEVMVVFGEGFIVEETRIYLLYDEPVNKEMECCSVVDVDDVIVSGNNDNNVGVSGGDNEVINQFGEEMVNHSQITSPKDGWYADVVGPVQLVPHDLDLLANAVAEEIRAAEAHRDQEHQVPSPEGVPEKQATVAPEAIEPTLGAQILDAIRELRGDFVRQELRLNAVDVRLEKLEDGIAQILRRSSFESTGF